MKKLFIFVLVSIAMILGIGMAQAGEKAPQGVYDLANSKLMDLGTNPIVVEAVKAQNAKGMSLAQIKEKDNEWKTHAGIADYMESLMTSECGKHLREIQNSADFYAEIFVMDNKGANVAMTDKTSDYWQGDEAKFKKSFNSGVGALFVDEVEFDDSSQAYLVQVSLPVKDGENVIGAITVGIDIDRIE